MAAETHGGAAGIPAPQGPVALIVGASGSLGDALAARIAPRCSGLGLHAFRNRGVCEARAEALRGLPCRASVFTADISRWDECKTLAESFIAAFGRLDELYLCAGATEDSLLPGIDAALWGRVMGVNVDGPFFLLRHFARQLVRQRSGFVVAVGSYAGACGRPGGAVYAASKSALVGLVKSAARELGPFGVRVLCVLPGFLPDSKMGRAADPRFVEAARDASCLKGFGGTEEAAKFIAGLADVKWASGQVFNLDSRIIPAV
ncbi:MAG: SDR family NAD(P)-dependent oxidoreductase [Planctomycetota bacterium]|nr:SDR family NAD(P)-dependent oxidoreductase [Planctomycetota bacterium]